MQLTFDQIQAFAKRYDSELLATDPRLRNAVMVITEEGSVLCFEYAFCVLINHWYVIFTEHHRYHLYHNTDAQVFMRGPRIAIPELTEVDDV